MKILYDHQFFSIFPFSGVSRYIYEVARRLGREPDAEVSFFMGWHTNEYPFPELKAALHRYVAYRRPRFRGAPRIFPKLNDLLFPIFASAARPDIYHQVYYDFFLPSFKGKRIMTIYDMTSERIPEIFTDPNDRTINNKRESAARADGVIAISESTKRDVMEILKVPEEKIAVVYLANSLDHEVTEPSPLEAPYILYVGQRCPHKNFGALLSVFTEDKEINGHFSLVCFGGSQFTEDELSALRRAGLADRCVHVRGDDRVMARFYKHASLLVYPSLYEGFGMPILEAMHYGCPVLASNSSSLPEIVGQGGRTFDPRNRHDLSVKMREMLRDNRLRDACVKLGCAQEKKFSWERCADETYAFYRKILAAG